MALDTICVVGLELPLALRPGSRMTDEELLRFSARNGPYRFERSKEGEVVMMTPVGGIGGTHEFYVASMLYGWIEQTGRGVGFGAGTGFSLRDGSCLSPDAAWISGPRWEGLSERERAGCPPLCPEFVIEIRSRSDARSALDAKMELWLDNGAELGWLIDPVAGEATVYRPGVGPATEVRPEVLRGTGCVAGFELRMGRLWVGVSGGGAATLEA